MISFRKILSIAFIFTLTTMIMKVNAADSSSGCGISWEVLKDNSLVSSFSRSLTNATFSSTIAMTSGTSGCTRHSIVMKEKKPAYFAEANYDHLVAEIAMGKGEYLKSFARVLGCSQNKYILFNNELRKNFPTIINARKSNFYSQMQQILLENSMLKEDCEQLHT